MKGIWKTIAIVALIMVILGGILIGVSFITGSDVNRIQDLFCTTYNVSSFRDYFSGIAQSLLGISF